MFSVVLLLTYGAGYWLKKQNSRSIKQSVNFSNCDPSNDVCQIKTDDVTYSVKFNSPPSALVPFEVDIEVFDNFPQSIAIVFDMDGMDMGFNEYVLVKNANTWRAKVILPICSLGKKQWILRVKLKYDNEENITHFKFVQSHMK